MNLIEELTWRGMYHDSMPGTAEHLATNAPITGYIGFDPTAASLHIGNLATIMLLVHLQRAGHRPVALVGGATGMIGDPSGKSVERNLLDETTLRHNQAGIQAQLEKFLDFSEGPTGALVVNNYDWFKEIGFLGFLREVGKHLTVNYMMAKDSVKRRISGNEDSGADGLSYTEFSYQLLQGYDFVHLNKTLGCTLQMGASDQWGNITTGTELIRRVANAEGTEAKAYALTGQLITKADGTKYGKSETGTVWLDATMTSPYQFYQFFLNSADADAPRLIRVFTLLSKEEIEAIEAEHAAAPHLRTLQKALAADVTTRVHSAAATEAAIAASQVLFGGGDLASLDEATLLDVFAGVPHLRVLRAEMTELNAATFLSDFTLHKIFPSKGEARKMIQAGGVSINREKVTSPDAPVAALQHLAGKYLVVQKGKKNYFLVELV
ncbi:tyrosine--tRNA ligase [Microvirga sp. STS02]|uniref:tyrosine--tRNA ligase n=1 Tax=Hymenobacter negativus TaxID=2795026 RepID=UPI0018DCD05D|nr:MULTISPECIES: tyrosine--tRNA ligase [Bacteria]MBH8569415.1 tyrosine--tRNA ligase [Hymenobacter negativus]MBR7209151.1 tyrosine--tRNA ligase [Microvirga sp. STS02]